MKDNILYATQTLETVQFAKRQNSLFRSTPRACRMVELGLKARQQCLWSVFVDDLTGRTPSYIVAMAKAYAGRRADVDVIFHDKELGPVNTGLKWYIKIIKHDEKEQRIMENNRQTLCKPCAVKLSQQGRRLKALPGKSDKITCDKCGRRRYGLTYIEIPMDRLMEDKVRESK